MPVRYTDEHTPNDSRPDEIWTSRGLTIHWGAFVLFELILIVVALILADWATERLRQNERQPDAAASQPAQLAPGRAHFST